LYALISLPLCSFDQDDASSPDEKFDAQKDGEIKQLTALKV